jgi:DNA polymerase-1
MTPLLVLDCHYLCHRAFHSTGGLSHKGAATGVIFGFLKSIEGFKREFLTDRIVFCFEGKKLLRREIYPEYKAKRYPAAREEMEIRQEFKEQIRRLRRDYLPRIGFNNVFYLSGYEADDVMAQLAKSEYRTILVTADSDMFQCLQKDHCEIYNPQKQVLLTEIWFHRKYGISPNQWPEVKAMSGCSSDNVKGIRGVGEITALKYLHGKFPGRNALASIGSEDGQRTIRSNLKLVKLPFQGMPELKLTDDELSEKGWTEVCRELGMRSLAGRLPRLKKAFVR